MKPLSIFLSICAPVLLSAAGAYFTPEHRVSGAGVARDDISDELLALRTDYMIQSQTFTIMREPLVLLGARRITSQPLQSIFKSAARSSGTPQSEIEAIAFLESWGDAKAASPAGPKGVMQISEATARRIGLKVVHAKRYKVTIEKVAVTRRGKTTYKKVKHREPYTVVVRDDRLTPSRAIPAAAKYLARMEQRFGGRDWAIFAYHCGEGCVAELQELTRQARGVPPNQVTVARMFFCANPAWNRELYLALMRNMERDYSPTYWFRISRAEQLLALYRRNPSELARLSAQYKSELAGTPRAPHRLAVWIRKDDLVFQSDDDLRADSGRRLARAFDNPEFFGYRLGDWASDADASALYRQASPAALGTLLYIAFETRRLYAATEGRNAPFQPLEVASLVQPAAASPTHSRLDAAMHASGQVLDIRYAGLSPAERECLRFVLNDLGWEGYLGFVDEGTDSFHIGCSPESRDFFTAVFDEARKAAVE